MFMSFIKQRVNHQRGDTIVEVLVSIAVVSLVLGGAYVMTNNSLLASRAAQERSIALKLAEAQIEQVKGLAATDPDSIFGVATPLPFCISKNTGKPVTTSDSTCALDTFGQPTTVEPQFKISIMRSGAANNDFTLTETWSDVTGHGAQDSLQLKYRVYD